MKKRIIIFFIFFIGCLLSSLERTLANNITQNIVVDGAYYDWNVYYIDDLSGEKKCYIASFAIKSVGNYEKERKPYIMIAYFTAKDAEEISIYADYDYKLNSHIYLGLDNKQYRMITKGKMAWAKSAFDDKNIIKEILVADEIRVRGETLTGEYTIDNYSTRGLARAYKRMKELCEIIE